MAVPMSADRMVAALRAEGVTVVEHRLWRTNNRNHKGAWGPVHGVMIHHTVTSGTAPSVELCYSGHSALPSALPGPLCHGVIAKDGTVHMVGNGRANHAGSGDGDVLYAVINEEPLPADNQANTDGNQYFYGFEAINLGDGKDPWPAAQLEAIERVSAAVCRVHGWNARSVIGHLEWQPGKIDPRGFTMASMRARIADRLDHAPKQEESSMALNRNDFLTLMNQDNFLAADPAAPDYATNKHWGWKYHIETTSESARRSARNTETLLKKVDALQTTGLSEAQMARIAELVVDALAERMAE